MLDLRRHFSRFLQAEPGRLHFAAHSHHPWPDATRDAQLAAWDLAARRMDAKWEEALGPVLSACQAHVARHLRLPDPRTVAFAPNTHEFVVRILSALPRARPRILTTDGSSTPSPARWRGWRRTDWSRSPAFPPSRAPNACPGWSRPRGPASTSSGSARSSSSPASRWRGSRRWPRRPATAELVLDGYHAFLARPVDLSRLASRVFYTSGGYKYAMAGEGACFLHCPPGRLPRPRATGWFAAFGDLSGPQQGVPYPADGWRFFGSTFDPSGLFRLDAAMRWLEEAGVAVADIYAHAHALQRRFVAGLDGTGLDPARLVVPLGQPCRGNFLTFDLPDAEAWQARLDAMRVVTDRRGTRLRFGFGLYQTGEEVDALLGRLRHAAR
jgi:selenocysteine lyase/cysteine desulfurase